MNFSITKPTRTILDTIEFIKTQDFNKILNILQNSTYPQTEITDSLHKIINIGLVKTLKTVPANTIDLITKFDLNKSNLIIFNYLFLKLNTVVSQPQYA